MYDGRWEGISKPSVEEKFTRERASGGGLRRGGVSSAGVDGRVV